MLQDTKLCLSHAKCYIPNSQFPSNSLVGLPIYLVNQIVESPTGCLNMSNSTAKYVRK